MNDRSRGRGALWLLLIGIVPVALNLRMGITSVPPLLPQMVGQLPLSGVQASLLIALPTICFGVFAFAAGPLRAWLGDERGILVGLIALMAGLASRALFPTTLLFAGTIAAGCGIGLLNVLLTSLIRHRGASYVGRFLAINMLCLNLGSSVAAAVAVPIAHGSGSLGLSLGVWALLAAIGLACWLPQVVRPRREARRSGEVTGAFRLLSHPLAWALAGVMGMQSLSYYTTLSWTPTLLQSRGMGAVEAGLLVSGLGVVGLITATTAPLFTHRVLGQRVVLIVSFALEAVGFAGLVLAPLFLAPLCLVLIALGQGGLLPLALYFFIVRAADSGTAAGLSSMGQGVGYLVTSAGAFGVGVLYHATGSWLGPLVAFLVVVSMGVVCGLFGASHRRVPSVTTRMSPEGAPTGPKAPG